MKNLGLNDTSFLANTAPAGPVIGDLTGPFVAKTSLPIALDQFQMILAAGRLWAVGGSSNGSGGFASQYSITASGNGVLGTTWDASSNPLLVGRHRHGTVFRNNRLYVIGGNAGGNAQASVMYGITNGTASPTWGSATSMPVGRRRIGISQYTDTSNREYMYVTGGSNSGFNTVLRGTFSAVDETITYDYQSPMPTARWFLSTEIVNNYMYAIAGFDVSLNAATSVVYYAPVNPADGTVGTWQTTSALPVALQAHDSAVYNGHIYVTGGLLVNGTTRSDKVYFAKTNPDGTLGAWKESAVTLPTAVWMHQAAFVGNTLIVAGGSNNSNITISDVYATIVSE